ncbi:MAG TPA: hypothetical protein PKD54_09510 [Pirellulaceae bacterium]|nr:hypothetical protein [Pirellulaceae bacterium]
MWKAFFLAIGTFMIVLGVETLLVDKFVVAEGRRVPRLVGGQSQPFTPAGYQRGFGTVVPPRREFHTKEWLPWSLLAGGTITVMYTCSVHSRSSSDS